MLSKKYFKTFFGSFIIAVLAICTNVAFAQDSTRNVFFEKINDTESRFFFDQNYYLVDKNCEFKSIERVAKFDKINNHFEGNFVDVAADGRRLLSGSYANGLKDGRFVAYHPNQQIKWEVTFKENKPTGFWNYYYPDGRPLLSVSFHDSTSARIVSLWDERGKLRVKQGNGKYDFRNPIDGYSQYGFSFYSMRGKIKDGVPDSAWQVYFENPQAKQSEYAADETYRDGIFLIGNNYFEDTEYTAPIFSILPYDTFYRADALVFKPCTFDDFAGFTYYLSEYFKAAFQAVRVNTPVNNDFAFEVLVRKDGSARRAKVISELPEEIHNGFQRVVQSIEYFMPSFKDGDYIDDQLTVRGKVLSGADGQLLFQTNRIERKFEQDK